MKILAIDPGTTTGIAWGEFKNGRIPASPNTAMPRGFHETTDKIYRLLDDNPFDLVVVERFTISAATAKKSTGGSNDAIELIGVTRWLTTFEFNTPLEEQLPVDAKTFCDDAKLRRLGWYVKGLDHQRDALRHLILAAVRHQVVDLEQLLPGFQPEPMF